MPDRRTGGRGLLKIMCPSDPVPSTNRAVPVEQSTEELPVTVDEGKPAETSPRRNLTARRRRLSWLTSFTLHVSLLLALIYLSLPALPTRFDHTVNTVAQPQVQERSPMPAHLDLRNEAPRRETSPPVLLTSATLNQFVRDRWRAELERHKESDAAERQAELEQMAARLEKISSEERVEQMGSLIRDVLQVPERKLPASEDPPEGSFDHRSAQFDDVRKVEDENGKIVYEADMVDSAGRRMTVPLDAADGEEMFRLFEAMRKYPLLETIYRNLAMSVIDKLMSEAPAAKKRSSPQRSDEAANEQETPSESAGNEGT